MSNKARRHKRVRFHVRRRTAPGHGPGVVVVDPGAPAPVVRVVAFGPEELVETEVTDLDVLADLAKRFPVVWVDVQGLGNAETIRGVGATFGLHPLALEDVVNTHQRAKVEDYDDHLFLVVRMLTSNHRLDTEQVSLFFGKGFVVTFQERPGDCLEPVRKRLHVAKGRLRSAGVDFLAYALLDAVVDAYFPVLEQCGEWLDAADDEISSGPGRASLAQIHQLRGELLLLRRAVWPLRDAMGELSREPNPLVSDETRLFLRDCYDHTIQIIDLVETYREMCADLRDFSLSMVNNRMSEVMKVLTIIATIFIPLGFIAGVYGMNFDTALSPWNMPELKWRLGYPFALGIMVFVALGQIYYFWRRGWLRD
ncbi:MAG: magnesium/cobalt transporter CorA [Pirellulales bacterium]|nr:magnesium/cobalt transporter CorA [Pirellulales bacterium]